MSAADIITIIVAVGGFTVILGGVIVNIIQAARREIATIATKVDGAATAQVEKIERLTQQVTTLTAAAADHKQVAALLAQATATTVTHVEPPSSV